LAVHGSAWQFPVTSALLLINIAVYFVMVSRHVSAISPTTDQIIRWGGNYGPLSLGTQPWRLISCLFIHIGFVHLLANMWALFVLGRLAESLYGRASYLSTYLLSGIAGSLASMLWNPLGVSAGASGAIFGIAGALIATLFVGKIPLPKHNIRPVLATLVFWAGFDLLYGIWKTGVDNAAHLGGFIAGLVLGALLGHNLGPQHGAAVRRKQIFAATVVLVIALGAVVWSRNGYVVHVERARVLISKGAPNDAIGELLQASARRPNDAYVHMLLGQAYSRKGDYMKAQQEYLLVTQKKPNDAVGWRSLAQCYVAQGKLNDAASAWVRAAELSDKNGAVEWFQAGNMYYQLNRDQDAVKAYQKTVQLAPNYPEPWGSLGVMQMKVGQDQQAIVSLGRAVRLSPANPELRLLLGNAYLKVGKEQEAQEQFFEASKLRAAIQQRARQQQADPTQK
jgi:rhomboid protease GluP